MVGNSVDKQVLAGAVYVLGFDYGLRRLGVAVGQLLTRSAKPLGVVQVRQQQPDWGHVSRLIDEWQPDIFVVGLPMDRADSSQNPVGVAAQRFARQLMERYRRPFYMVDETLTSHAAAERDYARVGLDAVAAQIILETWFNDVY